MQKNNIPDSKEEILKGLVISEEDTRAQLQELVSKTKQLFRIEEKSKKIVFGPGFKFTNYEKILLYLIGKYFSKELNLIKENKCKLKEISVDLAIKATTLSKPLGKACSNGLVNKEGEFYSIAHYRIEKVIDSIIQKFKPKESKPGEEPGRESRKRISREKKKEIPEPERITVTANPKGIEDLAKDLGIEQERLHRLFEFEEKEIHILDALKGSTESKTQFNTALAYLSTSYYYFRQQEIESGKLSRIMEDLGIGALSHLHRNLGKDRKMLIPKKSKKRVDTYRITRPGIERGVFLIKEYFSKK